MSSKFQALAAAVAAQFATMSENELYRVDIEGDDLWQGYLSAFPAGTNPIYRVRTEHDGSYDRNFIRTLGNVVAIDSDGGVRSIWDTQGLDYPYNEVFAVLATRVRKAQIVSLFRHKERTKGYVSTIEKLDSGATHRWYHFNAKIADRHYSATPDAVVGDFNTKLGVYKRLLETTRIDVFDTVIELIEANNLYRGQEFLASLKSARLLVAEYKFCTLTNAKNRYLWQSFASEPASATLIRNTAIGTLLIDLNDGASLEAAVGAFEAKVAPTNYRRPTALITQRMVDEAAKQIEILGLESALQRRHATIEDVSVNNVLWVDNKVQAQMKDGIAGLLAKDIKAPMQKSSVATDISIDDFMTQVLPKASSLEAWVKNAHMPNFVTVTTGVDALAPHMFKWPNQFAWSYNGGVADSDMRAMVTERGGRVDGDFRFTHQWNYDKRNASLMDLHVFMPGHNNQRGPRHCDYGNDQRVGWNHRQHTKSGGIQDVDYVQAAPEGYVPVENITFPHCSKMPDGVYKCAIHNWRLRSPTQGGFKAEIEFDGQIFQYERLTPLKHNEWVEVAEVTLTKGVFSIKHLMPVGAASKDVWNVGTEKYVPITTIMLSPNYWDDLSYGNKHWFFLLEGCKAEENVRGFYNEYLRIDLAAHGKVFEVLANRTKCPASEQQLSGLGFSSTQRNSIVIRAKGERLNALYNVQF